MSDRAEIYLNEILRELRAITERIPYDARLPGTPNLTEEISHLMDKYLEQRVELAQLKTELQRLTIHDEL